MADDKALGQEHVIGLANRVARDPQALCQFPCGRQGFSTREPARQDALAEMEKNLARQTDLTFVTQLYFPHDGLVTGSIKLPLNWPLHYTSCFAIVATGF